MTHYNPNVDLDNENVYTKFGFIPSFCSQILSKNQILTSIKGRNSVVNLQKVTFNNPNIDLVVDDYVYKQFGLFSSIRSQDIERKPI